MNEEEFEQFARNALRPRETPEVTDDEIRDLLVPPVGLPSGAAEEVRALFLDKVFSKLHPDPVWLVHGDQQFGTWFRGVRKSARLPVGQIAAAIEEDQSFVEALEQGEDPPWQLSPDSVAKLMILYHVHFSAVRSLLRKTDGATETVAPPPRGSQPTTDLRAMMIDRGSAAEFIPEVKWWLENLRGALQRRKARRLLDLSRVGFTFNIPLKKDK